MLLWFRFRIKSNLLSADRFLGYEFFLWLAYQGEAFLPWLLFALAACLRLQFAVHPWLLSYGPCPCAWSPRSVGMLVLSFPVAAWAGLFVPDLRHSPRVCCFPLAPCIVVDALRAVPVVRFPVALRTAALQPVLSNWNSGWSTWAYLPADCGVAVLCQALYLSGHKNTCLCLLTE